MDADMSWDTAEFRAQWWNEDADSGMQNTFRSEFPMGGAGDFFASPTRSPLGHSNVENIPLSAIEDGEPSANTGPTITASQRRTRKRKAKPKTGALISHGYGETLPLIGPPSRRNAKKSAKRRKKREKGNSGVEPEAASTAAEDDRDAVASSQYRASAEHGHTNLEAPNLQLSPAQLEDENTATVRTVPWHEYTD